jgi:serine/threonine protein kinase
VYAGVYDETAGSSSVVRRPAAIKRIPLPPGERGENTRALVEREVALHRHLNQNSNRVTFLLGAHLDGSDAVFTAMERCGESLAQWLRSAPGGSVANLPPAERIAAAEALTAAVADVHAAGVTHNDIKPDNCLRAASGEFKLADLGLGVRLKTHERGEEKDAMYSMTTFAGYGVNVQLQGRPPEVLLNQNLTAAVDVWSLGNLMYAAFTGAASPFRDEENTSASSGASSGSGPLKDKHSPEASGIAGLYENQRIIRGTFSLRALETSKLPRHVVAAARVVLSDMLQPNPEDRPSAEEVLQHPVFWTPEKAVEKIREVNDEKLIPLKDKSGAALTPAEELRLVADVFGGGGGAEKGKKGGAHTSARADSSKNTEKRTVHAHAAVRAPRVRRRASAELEGARHPRAPRARHQVQHQEAVRRRRGDAREGEGGSRGGDSERRGGGGGAERVGT